MSVRWLTFLVLTVSVFNSALSADEGDGSTKEIKKALVVEVPLDKFTREECNKLLTERGFYKKSSADEDVPEEVKQKRRYLRKEEL